MLRWSRKPTRRLRTTASRRPATSLTHLLDRRTIGPPVHAKCPQACAPASPCLKTSGAWPQPRLFLLIGPRGPLASRPPPGELQDHATRPNLREGGASAQRFSLPIPRSVRMDGRLAKPKRRSTRRRRGHLWLRHRRLSTTTRPSGGKRSGLGAAFSPIVSSGGHGRQVGLVGQTTQGTCW